jgi:hypothetical protein
MHRIRYPLYGFLLNIFFVLVLMPISIFGQVTNQIDNGVRFSIKDSSGIKVFRTFSFDIDSSIYLEVLYDENGNPIGNNYILRNGFKITNYTLSTDRSLADHFKNVVLANFSHDNIAGCGRGLVVLKYMINENCDVIEVRLTSGIDNWYNKELLRCAELSLNTNVNCGDTKGKYLLCIVFLKF